MPNDRFRFRTPTLLNLAATAPYTHTGAYTTLLELTGHYVLPEFIFDDFMNRGGVCSIPQFSMHIDCAILYPRMASYFTTALNKVFHDRITDPDRTLDNLSNSPISDAPPLLTFLDALNDPCVLDRACLASGIPIPANSPDDHQLDATNINNVPL